MTDKAEYVREMLMSIGFGMLGRAIHYVRHDTRPLGLKLVFFEMPIAIGFGIIGGGLAQWFTLTGLLQSTAMISAGYVGPRIVDILIDHLPQYLAGKVSSSLAKSSQAEKGGRP